MHIAPYSLSRSNLHNGYLEVRPLKLPQILEKLFILHEGEFRTLENDYFVTLS